MKLSSKVAYNTIIQIISKTIAIALGLFTIAIMTRYLDTAGFGDYTTITTFVSYFATIADLGLTLVTVQLISQPGADEKKILGNLFGLRLATALGLIGLGPIVALIFPYSSAIKFGILISSLAFVFIALNQVFIGLFQKHLRMDKSSIAEVAGRIVLLATVWIARDRELGLNGMILATILANLVSFLLLYAYSLSYHFFYPLFDWQLWKDILRKSWPLAITIFFNLLYLRTDTLLLSLMKTSVDVGLYGAAYKVIDVLITLPFMFAGIILPIITRLWAENNSDKYQQVMSKSFDFMAMIAIPLIIGGQLFAGEIITVVAGQNFAPSGPILRILILASGIIYLGCMLSHAVIALDRQKNMIRGYFFVAITSIIGYLLFIPEYSYFGAAWVTVYSELAIALYAAYIVYHHSGFRPSWQVPSKAILSSFVMFIFVLWMPAYHFSIKILLAASVYFIFMIATKGISKSDILLLIKPNNYE